MTGFFGAGGMGGNVERHIGDDDRDGAAIEAMRDAEPTSDDVSFQDRVDPWMQACFGAEISADKLERGDRLLEEVLELLQSGDYPSERIAAGIVAAADGVEVANGWRTADPNKAIEHDRDEALISAAMEKCRKALLFENGDGVFRSGVRIKDLQRDIAAARAEIERLTKEREADHANINLKADFIEATINQLALAEAERDEARAQVAIAFETAEKALEARKYGDPDEREEYAFDAALDRGIVAIRALTPPDAKAALEAYGREKVLAKASTWKGPGETPHRYSPDYMAQGDCQVCGHTREAHQSAPDDLIDLIGEFGREVYYLLDDCETSGPVGEEIHTITEDGLRKVSAILDRIDALPFGEPGVMLGTGAMLQAAIMQTFAHPPRAQEGDGK